MPAPTQAAHGISLRARVCPQLVVSENHEFGKSVPVAFLSLPASSNKTCLGGPWVETERVL